MKMVPGVLAACVAIASSTALASDTGRPLSPDQSSMRGSGSGSKMVEKFVPKFDGLRFIETLVTAHR